MARPQRPPDTVPPTPGAFYDENTLARPTPPPPEPAPTEPAQPNDAEQSAYTSAHL